MDTEENFLVCDRDLDEESFERYKKASALAMDTETMGLVIERDRLCLVQICDSHGWATAIRIEKGQREAPKLVELLADSKIVKIFHYARFDLAQLKHTFGVNVQPVFCTKIASKIARTYTTSHGLKAIVQEFERVELDKSSQSSDWGHPKSLTPEQLSYAANDVRYLIKIREKLIAMLQREDRLELAQKCFDCLSVLVDLDLKHYQGVFDHK